MTTWLLLPVRAGAFVLTWSARILWMLAVQLAIVLLVLVLWLSLSTTAPTWLWEQFGERVPGLRLEGITGRFATGLDIRALRWMDEERELRVESLRLRWQPADLLQGRLTLDEVVADSLMLRQLRETPPQPLKLPELDLPLAWSLRSVQLRQLRWQPVAGEVIVLRDLALAGEGAGTRVNVTSLALAHDLGHASLQGWLETQGRWPLDAVLLVRAADERWPEQRINAHGDLGDLGLRARGPRQWPFDLSARVNVMPVSPEFSGALTWPRWQPPGQKDWLLDSGGLVFKGTAQAGEAKLSLRASPRAGGDLPWPAGWPRRAELSGPLRWRINEDSQRLDVDWRGRFGAMPWLVAGQLDSSRLQATRLDMQLAESRLHATGWPLADGRLSWHMSVPRLQRFQSLLQGAAELSGDWRGDPWHGQGRLQLTGRQWRRGEQLLMDQLAVSFDGGLRSQRWQIDGRRDEFSASLALQGGLDTALTRWRGLLQQGRIDSPRGRWQLQAPAALDLSAERQLISRQCWRMSPWQLCGQASLLPERWTADLLGESGGDGSLRAMLRRDPRQANPALDADLQLRDLNLARLPVSLPEGLAVQGRAQGRARLSGTLAEPLLHGDFALSDAAVQMPFYGVDWRPLTLRGRLLGDRADWQGSLADQGGGTATLTGSAGWRPQLVLQMKLVGSNLGLRYAPWATARVSPDLSLVLRERKLLLRGQVRIPEAAITLRQPQGGGLKTSSDVRIVRTRDGRVVAGPVQVDATGLPLDMSVGILLGDKIRISGMGLDSGAGGQLLLVQQPGRALTAHGELHLADDAVYEAYGQRLSIRSGRLLFAGPVTRPDLHLEAVRKVSDATVGVRLTGRAQAPKAELFSDEAMPEDEILSMLVLGRSLGNARAPTAADRQAMALGAALKLGGRTGALERVGQRLGISDFALGTEGDSDKTQVALSGYISPDLFLSFGMGVFEPTQTLKMRYQLNKRLSLEAMTSLQSAITLFYSWRF